MQATKLHNWAARLDIFEVLSLFFLLGTWWIYWLDFQWRPYYQHYLFSHNMLFHRSCVFSISVDSQLHPPCFLQYYTTRTYPLMKEIEAHLECSPIRFPDPVLYTEKTDSEYHIFLGLIYQQMDERCRQGRDLPQLQKGY